MLDNGTASENRYEIIDMKNAAFQYESGKGTITRNTYNKLISGLDLIENELKKE